MNRRTILALCGSGGVAFLAGCWGGSRDGTGCPEPKLDDELTYEVRNPEGSSQPGKAIDMLTDVGEIDDFGVGDLTDDDRRWIEETDFGKAFIVDILETAGGGASNSGIEVLGVDREPEETIGVYSCIADTGRGDAAVMYRRLLRVFYEGQPPERGKHTHWQEGERSTSDTNQ